MAVLLARNGNGGGGNNPPTPTGTPVPSPGETQAIDNLSCQTRLHHDGVKIQSLGNYCIPKDPLGFASEYYSIGLGLIGGVSVLFIIFGAYILLTSSGNPMRIRNGKTYIFYALFGLLLAIFGFVFLEVIAVDILHIPGFSH